MTDEWDNRGVKEGLEYAILTNEITKAWVGITTKEYKQLKGLQKENLRDNMTNLELVLNMLAETATTEISKSEKPVDMPANKKVAKRGGSVAGKARTETEKELGRNVISDKNYLQPKQSTKKLGISKR